MSNTLARQSPKLSVASKGTRTLTKSDIEKHAQNADGKFWQIDKPLPRLF